MTDNKNKIQVIEILNPFEPNAARKHDTLDYRPGKTLADLFPGVIMRREFVFSLNGKIIEDGAKALTYPQAGDVIVMCPVVAGGGDEGGGKSILRIVAIVALAFFTGGAGGFAAGLSGAAVGSVGYSLAYAGIMMAGSMVINALLPPPKTKATPGGPTASDTPTYGIDGPKNVSAEGIVVPVTYGTHRYGGNLINAYVTNDNNSQLLHLLYNCGEGPIASISDIQINDTPIANYGDYQIETRLGLPDDTPIPWFAQQVVPRAVGQELTTAFITKVTETEVDQIRLDFTCPAGMYGGWETKPSNYALYSPVLAEIRKVGTTDWQPFSPDLMVISGNQKTALRRSFFSPPLPEAKYEIRVRRDRPASGAGGAAPGGMIWVDNIYWTDYNEIQFEEVAYRHTALLGIRIRMTDQLNGLPTVTHLNGGRVIRCWDATTGQWLNQASNNPAWISLDALTNKRYGGAQPMSRFDLERWKEWAAHCSANGLKFNGIFDTQSNVWDATQPVFRAGHAGRTNVGTRFSVAIERQETPRMMFSVANMIQGSFKQSWLSSADRANELEITWVDKDDGYRQKIMRVVDTLAVNKGPKSSQVAFTGLTSAEEVWRDANILLNQNRLLLQTVEFSAPLEAIACSVGDVVLVQHDMPKWSLAGRLEAGSTVGKVMLDRPVQMSPNDVYSVLVHMSAVKRFSGTVSFMQGTGVFVSGFPGGVNVRRVKVAGKDLEVNSAIQQGNSHGVILSTIEGIAVGMPIELWDTDAIETRLVVNTASEPDQSFTELTLASPLPTAPEIYTQWMFGKTNRTGKPFRIRSIRGTHDYQRDITALEYNPDSYLTTQAPPAPNYSDLERYVKHASIDGVSEEVFIIGPSTRSRVTVHFSGQDETYFMSNVYLRRNEGDEEKVGENTGQVTVEAALGDELVFRVVARDVFMRSAPRSTAPTIYHRVAGRTLAPNDATGLNAVMDSTGWQATWDPSLDPDVTASELRIGPTWETARLLWRGNATSCRFAFQAAGEHQLRLRHCIGQTDGLYSGNDAVKTIVVLPPTQPIVSAEVDGRSVSLTWQDCVSTQPLFGYKIQKGPNAQELQDIGSSSSPNFQRIEATAGMHRYWVTALDVVGNQSAPGQIEVQSLPSIDEAIGELTDGLAEVIADLGQTNQNVTKEVQDRINADAAEATARANAIAVETANRAAALQAETTARTNAITTQANRITQEITDRAAAITAEQTARGNAIAAEQTARANAIAGEVTARNAAIAVETTNRTNALTAEAAARATAITNAVSAETAARNQAIAAEATLRSNADQAEVTARTNAILAEAQTRQAAIASEATARSNGDEAEATARQNLATQLQTADQVLTSAIQNEATIRSTADASEVSQRESLGITLIGRTDVAATLSRVVGPSMRAGFAAAAVAVGVWELPTPPTSGWLYDEQQARLTADSVEVAARESLAAQMRGSYAGTDLAQVTSGLIFSERQARVMADTAEVTARQALETTVTNNKTSTDAAIVSEQNARTTADSALGTRVDTLTTTVNTDRTNANTAITSEQTARANADTALGSRIDTLTTTVNNNQTSGNAAVVGEATARAAADAAEAAARETLATSITGMPNPADQLGAVTGDSLDLDFGESDFEVWQKPAVDTLSSGLIFDERQARVTADAAEVTARQALEAVVNTNKGSAEAAMTAEQTARANADAAEVTAREALQTQMRGNYAGTDLAQVSTGLIASEKNARTTADTAIVGTVTSLQTTVTNNKTTTDAAILAEQTARANADTAEATARQALQTTVTTNKTNTDAAIVAEQNARSTADGALGTRIDGVIATANTDRTNANSAMTAEQTVRASADTALGTRVDTLTTTVNTDRGTASTAITNEQTARANADTALGGRIDTLTSTVSDNKTTAQAAVNEEAATRATADTAEAAQRASLGVVLTGAPAPSNTLAGVVGPSLKLSMTTGPLGVWEPLALDVLSSGLIFDERQARITADTAEVTARQALATTVTNNKTTTDAALAAEQTARSTADAAEVTARESLATQLRGTATGTDVATVTSGLLFSEKSARTTADTAIANSVTALTTTVTNNKTTTDAAILAEQTTRATADTANANEINSLRATVNDNKTTGTAAINAEAEARATADTAEVAKREALSVAVLGMPQVSNTLAEVEGPSLDLDFAGDDLEAWLTPALDILSSGLLFDERKSRISADEAEVSARQVLEAKVNTNKADTEAAIVTEQTARAAADSANADSITALTATVNNVTNGLPSKATNTAVNALTTRVTNAEGLLTSQGDAITSLNSSLELGRADSQASLTSDENMANAAAWRSHYGTNLATNFVTVPNGQVATTVCRSPVGGASFWNYSKSKVVIDPARTYRITAWIRRVGANGTHYFNFWRNNLGTYGNSAIALGSLPENTWAKITWQTLGSVFGDTSISPGFALNHSGGTAGYSEIQGYRFEDVTDALRITATETSKADATAVNALTTRVTNAEGTITSQASSLTSLTATVNGHTSSISTNATAIADLTGNVKATWRLNVDANGKTAGMIIDNNGTVSTIAMVVDKFAIATPGPGGTFKYPFTVGNVAGVSTVGVDGNLVVDGTIITRTLAAEAVTAEKIKAKSLTADQIAAGAITADLINVGVGSNLVPDSAFHAGDAGNRILNDGHVPAGWGVYDNFASSSQSTFGINAPSHDWHPIGASTTTIFQPNEFFNNIQDKSKWTQVHSGQIPVTAGQRYEFSVYVAAHRCQAWCAVEFYDQTGAVLLNANSTTTNDDELAFSGGKLLSQYKRIGGFATAPENAVISRFIVRKGPTKAGTGNSWMFATQPMMAVASLSQTVFSPYAPAGLGTAITPAGISTPSLSAISATVGLLRTSASGQRTEIDNNGGRSYDGNNVLRVRWGVW